MLKGKQKPKTLVLHCVAEIGHFQFVILSLLPCCSFSRTSQRPEISPGKKEHLLLAVTKLMTKACPGAISLVLFLPKKSILGIGKAEHCRTSVSQETDELLLAMAMSPIYPSKQTAQLACLQMSRVLTNKVFQYFAIAYSFSKGKFVQVNHTPILSLRIVNNKNLEIKKKQTMSCFCMSPIYPSQQTALLACLDFLEF